MPDASPNTETIHAALVAAAADLKQGFPSSLTVEQARLLSLGAWCFWAARPGTAYRAALARDFADEWQKQQQRAAALAPLFDAWDQAGVTVAASKGWAMAWAVYPHEALRYCGDVDVLVDPADARRACGITLPPNWVLIDSPGLGDDMAAMLLHEPLQLLVEVHTSVSQGRCIGRQLDLRITRRMLADSREVTMGQGPRQIGHFRALQPADLALALALNRGWSGDAWRCKPHDYLDLKWLAERCATSEKSVARRARDLGIASTWAVFSRICSPAASRFDLLWARRHPWQRRWREARLWVAGAPPRLRLLQQLAVHRALTLWRIARAGAVLLRVVSDLRSRPSPQAAAEAAASAHERPVRQPWPIWQLEQVARVGYRLLRPLCELSGAGPCVVQSLALFRLLRRHGHGARWCMGYRPDGQGGVAAHAWVECDTAYALGLSAHRQQTRYRVTYKSPPTAKPPPHAP